MDSGRPWIIPLDQVTRTDIPETGTKTFHLAELLRIGFRVPPGFCLTGAAYLRFLRSNGLDSIIAAETARKPFREMRWEEIWDVSLRIRNAFALARMPYEISEEVLSALDRLRLKPPFAVRSTGSREDTDRSSFAGLHESFVNIRGKAALFRSIRLVWASLWSDSALLYRRELGLDPAGSVMPVLIQAMIRSSVSGVAFGKDPRQQEADSEIVEAVPGLCSGLVSGEIDPDRWILSRNSGTVLSWTPGRRQKSRSPKPLLQKSGLKKLHQVLRRVAKHFAWEADLEWTGAGKNFVLLQARPVTGPGRKSRNDERPWYLSLKPAPANLQKLARKISRERIPAMIADGETLAREPVETLDAAGLADSLCRRRQLLEFWRKIYREEFIPFAHGVRHFGMYYNDLIGPADPFEFVKMLRGEAMISVQRNRELTRLAQVLQKHPALKKSVQNFLGKCETSGKDCLRHFKKALEISAPGFRFLNQFESFLKNYADLSYKGRRLTDQIQPFLGEVIGLARKKPGAEGLKTSAARDAGQLKRNFFKKAGRQRKQAEKILETALLSWRLRDDDNLHLAKIESQFLRALASASGLLKKAGRLKGREPSESDFPGILKLLKSRAPGMLRLRPFKPGDRENPAPAEETFRQLTGNPASPGLARGRACLISGAEDLKKFRKDDVLVCDAIQPQITHLVPLASAVIERRGGMLIHGAIIARELGVPCVNGIPDLTRKIRDGMLLDVDGHLGIVSIGEPDFRLEHGKSEWPRAQSAG